MRPILAVDPGITTGWAHTDPSRRLAGMTDNAGQVQGVIEFMRWANSYLASSVARGVVVCENFVPRGNQATTWQPASLHIIGALMFLTDRFGWGFILQSAAEAKSFATNDKLKRAGWWVPGQDHARDALRHLMRHLCVTEHDVELLRAVAP